MKWKIKSFIQNSISLLPEKISYDMYYFLQRSFGALRPNKYSPVSRMVAAVEVWDNILSSGRTGKGKIFFEVGTGRAPISAFANYLMGANSTITVDLNPYVKEELCIELLGYIDRNKEEIEETFGKHLVRERLDAVIDYSNKNEITLSGFLKVCEINYLAPQDAAATNLSDESVDYFMSYNVFEHIPENILRNIVIEGNRLLKDDGLQLHRIDYSDHFSHSDKTITSINFLQFSEKKWNKYAGNKYMYMNRLRHDDFKKLFEACGCEMISEKLDKDDQVEEVLGNKTLLLDKRFKNKSNGILSITAAWVVYK